MDKILWLMDNPLLSNRIFVLAALLAIYFSVLMTFKKVLYSIFKKTIEKVKNQDIRDFKDITMIKSLKIWNHPFILPRVREIQNRQKNNFLKLLRKFLQWLDN